MPVRSGVALVLAALVSLAAPCRAQGMGQWPWGNVALWPAPKTITISDHVPAADQKKLRVDSSLKLVSTGAHSDIVAAALVRYHDYLFDDHRTGGRSQWQCATPGAPPRVCSNISSPGPKLTRLSVDVADGTVEFGMDTDESYQLDVPAQGEAKLTAKTPVGALRGLE